MATLMFWTFLVLLSRNVSQKNCFRKQLKLRLLKSQAQLLTGQKKEQ